MREMSFYSTDHPDRRPYSWVLFAIPMHLFVRISIDFIASLFRSMSVHTVSLVQPHSAVSLLASAAFFYSRVRCRTCLESECSPNWSPNMIAKACLGRTGGPVD